MKVQMGYCYIMLLTIVFGLAMSNPQKPNQSFTLIKMDDLTEEANSPTENPTEEHNEPTPIPQTPEEQINSLVHASRLPISPLNVTDSAKVCSFCGEGPLMGCPRSGDCGPSMICCYDKCRARQVCRDEQSLQNASIDV